MQSDRMMAAGATPEWQEFAGPWALAEALAGAVAGDLRAGIAMRAHATLVLSGGTTPRRFLEALAREPLGWAQVTITLADERWVPPDHARSNERLVRDNLLHGEAGAATFIALYTPDAPDPESGIVEIAANLAAVASPFDVVVLGMGGDGHCASLFPGGDRLREALQPDSSVRVLPMRAPAADEPRITLTLPALACSRAMYLHIEGVEKKNVLEHALSGAVPAEQAPVAAVLAHSAATPRVFYCP